MPPKRSKTRVSATHPNPIAPSPSVAQYSQDELSALPVTTLRAHLRSLSLSTAGNKHTLVLRLFTHFHSQRIGSPQPPLSTTTGQPTSNADGTNSQGDLQALVSRIVTAEVHNAIQQLQHSDSTNISEPSADIQDPPAQSPSSPIPQGPGLPNFPLDLPNNASPPDLPPVPPNIASKIAKGEYVDFNSQSSP